MIRDDALLSSVERLCDLEVEYDVTVRVLAVVVERLQRQTRSKEIQVSQQATEDLPDLTAFRDDDGSYVLRTSR